MEIIGQYLDAPVDYSDAFAEKVKHLGEILAAELGIAVEHNKDMNYNAGQQLIIYLLPDGSVTSEPRDASYALKVVISSKGPFWALLSFCKPQGSLEWSVCSTPEVAKIQQVIRAICRVMRSAKLHKVEDETLDQMVPGQVTELDGAPATVRDVFFCELC